MEDLQREPALVARRLGMADAARFGQRGCTNYLRDVHVVASQPGHIHSLAVAANGQCFSWGCGSDGRTGLAAYRRGPGGSKRLLKCYVSSPSQIEALETKRVLYATTGRYSSVFIVEEGGTQQEEEEEKEGRDEDDGMLDHNKKEELILMDHHTTDD